MSASLTSFKVYLNPVCFGPLDLYGKRPLNFLNGIIIRILWDKTYTPRLQHHTKIDLFALSVIFYWNEGRVFSIAKELIDSIVYSFRNK